MSEIFSGDFILGGKNNDSYAQIYVQYPNTATKVYCYGSLKLTNLLNPQQFSMSSVTVSGDEYTFLSNTTAMINQNLPNIISGHKYYGRCYQKAQADSTFADGRFEYFKYDGMNMVFTSAGQSQTDNTWHLMSSIQYINNPETDGYVMRSFTVNGNKDFYRKEMMIIDLTAAYGVGNEPSKQWCDGNIPYFIGDYYIPVGKSFQGKIDSSLMCLFNIPNPGQWTVVVEENGSQRTKNILVDEQKTYFLSFIYPSIPDTGTLFFLVSSNADVQGIVLAPSYNYVSWQTGGYGGFIIPQSSSSYPPVLSGIYRGDYNYINIKVKSWDGKTGVTGAIDIINDLQSTYYNFVTTSDYEIKTFSIEQFQKDLPLTFVFRGRGSNNCLAYSAWLS